MDGWIKMIKTELSELNRKYLGSMTLSLLWVHELALGGLQEVKQ